MSIDFTAEDLIWISEEINSLNFHVQEAADCPEDYKDDLTPEVLEILAELKVYANEYLDAYYKIISK